MYGNEKPPFFFLFSGVILAYLNVIVNCAIESQLPERYVSFLERIKHNEKDAHPEILAKLFPEDNEIQ